MNWLLFILYLTLCDSSLVWKTFRASVCSMSLQNKVISSCSAGCLDSQLETWVFRLELLVYIQRNWQMFTELHWNQVEQLVSLHGCFVMNEARWRYTQTWKCTFNLSFLDPFTSEMCIKAFFSSKKSVFPFACLWTWTLNASLLLKWASSMFRRWTRVGSSPSCPGITTACVCVCVRETRTDPADPVSAAWPDFSSDEVCSQAG